MRSPLPYFFEIVWNICFPLSKDAMLVSTLTSRDIERQFLLGFEDGIWRLSSFKDRTIRALLHESKFHRNAEAQELLSELLIQLLNEKSSLKNALWLPVPLSAKRMRERGYNQVNEILRKLPTDAAPRSRGDCLTRIRDTKPQTDLDRTERLSNVQGAFTVNKPECVHAEDIVILDDVTTTGATLKAAREAVLLHHPRSVTLVALAH